MKKARNIVHILLIMILLIIFFYSGYQIVSYVKESIDNKKLVKDLTELAVEMNEQPLTIEDFYANLNKESSDKEENKNSIGSGKEAENGKEDTKEKEYVVPSASPIKVNFDLLKKTNEDVKAWLYCEDTMINYPVAQGADNSEYLYTLLNGEYNRGGTLFMEYTNKDDFSDWNTLIYGHNMKNNTMFGTLTDYNDQEYYDEHPIWFLNTPNGNYAIELISGFVTDIYGEIYTIPQTMEEKDALVQTIMRKSNFATKAKVSSEDRLITFSTCTYDYDEARYVLIGILKEL